MNEPQDNQMPPPQAGPRLRTPGPLRRSLRQACHDLGHDEEAINILNINMNFLDSL